MSRDNWSETAAANGNEFFNYMQNYGASQDIPPTEVDNQYSNDDSVSHTVVDDEDVTQIEEDFSFVIGWLVCIEGPQKGRDFRLHSGGYNRIGRNPSYDVALIDSKVSREFNMWACYDALTQQYLMGAKAGGNLVHLNDALLPPETPRQLQKNDKIRIGDTVLMFIPLCDSEFHWNM